MTIPERAFGVLLSVIMFLGVQTVSAQLKVDFNSTTQDGGPHNEAGFQAYDAGHEVSADFVPKSYTVVFPSGAATVTVIPAWPNTIDNRVRQMIDRFAATDASWVGNNIDLLTDWIGSDSRTVNGGNGDWDRIVGLPTYLTLVLSGLPAGQYAWLSYHHDTEYMWSDFQVEISVDGGGSFGPPTEMQMTCSSIGGDPRNPFPNTGASDPNPKNLPSTFTTAFTADGANDVVLRFAPFIDGVDPVGVHKQFFGMNGFELVDVVQIFADGFENGSTSEWSLTVP